MIQHKGELRAALALLTVASLPGLASLRHEHAPTKPDQGIPSSKLTNEQFVARYWKSAVAEQAEHGRRGGIVEGLVRDYGLLSLIPADKVKEAMQNGGRRQPAEPERLAEDLDRSMNKLSQRDSVTALSIIGSTSPHDIARVAVCYRELTQGRDLRTDLIESFGVKHGR